MILEKFNHYWNQWSERERILVVFSSVCVGLYVFYVLCFVPLNAAIRRNEAQLSAEQGTLQWMQYARRQYRPVAMPQSLNRSQLLTLFGQKLAISAFHDYTYQLEQTGTGDIQLAFEEVPYNDFLIWFKKMNTQYAFTIKQFSAESTMTPGTVKLLVVISIASM